MPMSCREKLTRGIVCIHLLQPIGTGASGDSRCVCVHVCRHGTNFGLTMKTEVKTGKGKCSMGKE